MFIFFACPKKTNQKKGQPYTWSSKLDFPALLEKAGRCETREVYTPLRGAQTVLALIRPFLRCSAA